MTHPDQAWIADREEAVAREIVKSVYPRTDPDDVVYSAPSMGDPGGPIGPAWSEYGLPAARAVLRLLSEIDRLAHRAEGDWQPISTAPTNGTQVLLCYSRADLGEHWPLVLIAGMDKEGYWVWQGRASRAYSAKPLGWKPLPEALRPSSAAGR